MYTGKGMVAEVYSVAAVGRHRKDEVGWLYSPRFAPPTHSKSLTLIRQAFLVKGALPSTPLLKSKQGSHPCFLLQITVCI